MLSVNVVTASELLGICCQRIRQLIYANRVKGAFKTPSGWQIPLYGQMPRIIPANHGMKGTWRIYPPKKPTIIHVNRQKIATNRNQNTKDPVIAVRMGSEVKYGHQVLFEGKCKIVYEPNSTRKHGGAKVWIEVSPTTKIRVMDWNQQTTESLK